jgi:tetratricopeptide (TPR) repeat protein
MRLQSQALRIALWICVGLAWACAPPARVRLSSAPLDSAWIAPKRPRLPVTADTNASIAYESWGISKIEAAPDSAAAAFYWASRLDPWRASPYYERGVALVLTHAQRPEFAGSVYPWTITRQLSVAELALVDSLNTEATLRDPFLERSLDRLLNGSPPRSVLKRLRDPAQRGYWDFAMGAYDSAVADLGKALEKQPDVAGLRMLRAISFFYLERFDSTARELNVMLSRLTAREQKEVVRFYRSKAMLHYTLGIALVQKGDSSAAGHFEQALVEDLSFYMARVRLAGMALARADTVAAIASIGQALEIRDDDPALHYFYGVLQRARDPAAAMAAFERALTLDPVFAAPQMQLALVADVRGDTARAIAAYNRFLTLAPRDEPQIPVARARRDMLTHAARP